MNFYAMMAIMVFVEVIRYEKITTGKWMKKIRDRIMVIFVHLLANGGLFIFILKGEPTLDVANYSGMYVFCFFSFVMDVMLLIKTLKNIKE